MTTLNLTGGDENRLTGDLINVIGNDDTISFSLCGQCTIVSMGNDQTIGVSEVGSCDDNLYLLGKDDSLCFAYLYPTPCCRLLISRCGDSELAMWLICCRLSWPPRRGPMDMACPDHRSDRHPFHEHTDTASVTRPRSHLMFDGQIARLAQGHDCWLVRCLWDGWVSLARLPARLRGETLLSSLLWTGQPPPANIVVVAELWGGHGDALCMVRYLPLLTECGYRVGYKCAQPGLGKLLRQSFPSDLHFQDEAHIKNNKPVPLRAPTYLFQQQYLCRAFNGKLTPRGVGSGRPNQKLEYRPRKKVNPYVPEKPYLRADPARVEH